MDYFPRSVVLFGEGETNPAYGNHNYPGTLLLEKTGLVFRGGVTHVIPYKHIDELYSDKRTIGSKAAVNNLLFLFGVLPMLMLGFVGGFGSNNPMVFLFPVALIVWWYIGVQNTATSYQIVVKAWDENYGMDTTTRFQIGTAWGQTSVADQMVREINNFRGKVRGAEKDVGRVRR